MMTATKKLTVDPTDITTLQEAIRSGLATTETLHIWLNYDGELIDGNLIVEPDTWYADDGNAEVNCTAGGGHDAAEQYVEGGDWGDCKTTSWVTVTAWREAIDEDGNLIRVDEEDHAITIETDVPDCYDDGEHEWKAPHELVGGCEENPGVWGSGGGVKCHTVCLRCGCGRVEDSWAQNPETGEQGLDSTEYTEGEYTESLETRAEQCGERIGEAIAEAADSGDEWPGIDAEDIDKLFRGKFRESVESYAEVAYDAAIASGQ